MLPKEILAKIKKIQLKISRLSDEVISGQYVSAFKGAGMEFDEVREYIPGDDIRSIDWNVTARAGSPFSKRYAEERELTVMLLVDLSGSQYFGTVNALKSEIAAEVSALIAFLAIKNNDKVGLLIFSDACEKYLPPQNGRFHVLRVIREILGYQPSRTGTDIGQALEFASRVLKRRSVVFLISDFREKDFAGPLQRLAKSHDLIAVRISDPREFELPAVGLLELQDNESGIRTVVDTSSPEVRAEFRMKAAEQWLRNSKMLAARQVDLIEITTDKSYLQPLQRFFSKRGHRRVR
ncbi:MAG: DUF58 domain-containing protein [Bacillota bacterium]